MRKELETLIKKSNRVRFIFTFLIIFIYFSFIFLIAFGKDTLSIPISENSGTNLGIILGIGVIISSWMLTGLYVLWANRIYDPEVEKIIKNNEVTKVE